MIPAILNQIPLSLFAPPKPGDSVLLRETLYTIRQVIYDAEHRQFLLEADDAAQTTSTKSDQPKPRRSRD